MQLNKVVQGFRVGDPVKLTNPDKPETNGHYLVTGFKGQELQLAKRKPLALKIRKLLHA